MTNIKQSSAALTILKSALLFIASWLFPAQSWGQLDTDHWIPPLYSGSNEDEYGYLYISTPETTPFPVTISYRHHFFITSFPFSFDKYIDTTIMVSNSNPIEYYPTYSNINMVVTNLGLNKALTERGFILKGPKEFYVSYRIYSDNQAGCITSKGKAALGTTFRIGHLVADLGNHTVGMIATEDNTLVTISNFRPGTYLMSNTGPFLANTPISFTLNAGESYVISMEDDISYQNNFTHGLFGLLITSSKPIAVNCGSWLGSPVDGNSSYWDIGIDQIVPLENVGNEYILMAGEGHYSIESGLVVGHFDSTKVFVNGSTTPIILNAGKYLNLNKDYYFDSQGFWRANMYIRTDKKVFVYQSLGGGAHEKTAALNFIPPTNCQTGNFVNNIPFVDEIGSEQFVGEVQVVASSTANTVQIRKNGQLVPIGSPTPVQGNPDYVIYRTDLDGTISVNSDKPIQVAISGKSGAAGQGGYYSDFKKTFAPEVAISPDQSCLDTLFLQKKYINGGVTWYLNNQVLTPVPPVDSILAITQPGDYMVIGKYITFCNEEVFDTAYYTVSDNFFSVGSDVVPFNCSQTQQQGQIIVQVTGNGTYQYSLDNGAFGSNPVFDVSSPGQHTVRVQDQQGCTKALPVSVGENSPTTFTATICPGETVEVNGTTYSQANTVGTEYIPRPGDCDSIVNITLNPLSAAIGTVNATHCKGDSLEIGAVVFNENNPSGTATLHNASVNGCDSIVEVQLYFLSEIETHIEISSCNPADTGVAVQVLPSYLGCDSTVITTTTFRDTVVVEQFATTCNPALVGVFQEHKGCDSVITTLVSLDLSNVSVQYDTVFTCNVSEVGNDTIFVNGQNWCDGAIFRTTKLTQTVLLEKDNVVCRLSEVGRDTFYFGCDSVIYLNKIYDWAGTSKSNRSEWVCQISEVSIDTLWLLTNAGCDSLDIIERKQAPINSTTLYRTTCNPDHAGESVAVLQNQYGCDSIVTTVTTFEPSSIPVTYLTHYTCRPNEVGEITLTYQTPEDCDSLVVVTTYYDANLVPMLDADAIDETCPGSRNGSVLLNTFNGTPPFSYYLNGVGPLQSNSINNLAPGDYQLLVADSLGCADSAEVTVHTAQEVTVALSSTINMTMCDSIWLVPEINLPGLVDSVVWSPNNGLDCPDCLSPMAFPKVDTKYELRVYYGDGCVATAVQYIKVDTCGNWYSPNVFYPSSSDPDNSMFTIYSDGNITNIKWLRIYDRWGGMVFEKADFPTNVPNDGWNGSYGGSKRNLGVYTWFAELEYANGYIEKASGDVTVIR